MTSVHSAAIASTDSLDQLPMTPVTMTVGPTDASCDDFLGNFPTPRTLSRDLSSSSLGAPMPALHGSSLELSASTEAALGHVENEEEEEEEDRSVHKHKEEEQPAQELAPPASEEEDEEEEEKEHVVEEHHEQVTEAKKPVEEQEEEEMIKQLKALEAREEEAHEHSKEEDGHDLQETEALQRVPTPVPTASMGATISRPMTPIPSSRSSSSSTIDKLATGTQARSLTSSPSLGATTNSTTTISGPTAAPRPIVQARGLSAASQALKKKQADEQVQTKVKAMAVEIPETDSIAERVKMFGGASAGFRAGGGGGGGRKMNVRDIVQKYKDVEERSLDEIAHVKRSGGAAATAATGGGGKGVVPEHVVVGGAVTDVAAADRKPSPSADLPGFCAAYSLSTASRPTTTAMRQLVGPPRRKMSHELAEGEIRDAIHGKSAVSVSSQGDSGVSQESVQSVRSAKSLFESLSKNKVAVDK